MGKIVDNRLYRYQFRIDVDGEIFEVQSLVLVDNDEDVMFKVIENIRKKEDLYKWNVETKILYDTIKIEKEKFLDMGCER